MPGMYVVEEKKNVWLHLVFRVHGTVLPKIWPRVTVVTIFAVLLTLIDEMHIQDLITLTNTPFVLVGLPLGIFLGFRNSASYDRFWEGRKLWGSLVNTTRSAARQYLLYVGPQRDGVPVEPASEEERAEVERLRKRLVTRTIAFVHALRASLRDESVEQLAPYLDGDEVERLRGERNVPSAITFGTGQLLRDAWQRGWIHPWNLRLFEDTLVALTDIHGACERIKTTPVPFSYIALIHRIVAVYCFFLPLGLIDTLHHYTPLAVAMVSYSLFGLDAIGDEIEMPFGKDTNDLPLAQLATNIEINLRQRLGETELPEPLRPTRGVLL
jgi:putative membrane protein